MTPDFLWMAHKASKALEKFDLNLLGKVVLTEAATNAYVVTSVLAAAAGATVFAYSKNSRFANYQEVVDQTHAFSKLMGVEKEINISDTLADFDLGKVDVITNSGFLRPITADIIFQLPPSAVLSLMWEPWEYRATCFDLEACREHGIKVYGTNESDERVRTMEYIGFIVLSGLLRHKRSPISSSVLLLGSDPFLGEAIRVLKNNKYNIHVISNYEESPPDLKQFDAIVALEHHDKRMLIGSSDQAYINSRNIPPQCFFLHVAGLVDLSDVSFDYMPSKPADFGYMSYTVDYADPQGAIDLHAAGLKVAEGMLKANELKLSGKSYKIFMEENYPALAFEEEKYW